MARGNTVKLIFAGDASRLSRTVKKVEATTSSLSRGVGRVGMGLAAFSAAGVAAGVAAAGAIAGVGVAVIGVGVLAAAQSEKVKKAFSGLGDHVKKEVQKIAQPFEPVLLGIERKTRATFDRVKPLLADMFVVSAPFLDKLADGLLGFIEGALPGLKTALENAKPVIDVISEGLKGTGKAIGDMFAKISGEGGAQSAADTLKQLFDFLNTQLIPALGTTLRFLMEWGPALLPLAGIVYGLYGALRIVSLGMGLFELASKLSALGTVAAWSWAALVIAAKWLWMATMATIHALRIAVVWTVQTLVTVAGMVLGWAVAGVTIVAGWVWMGVQALIAAGRVAAAWFIALGPIGWVAAAVIAIGLLIWANWERIVAWTRGAWTAVSNAVSSAWAWIKGVVSSAASAVVGALSAAWNKVRSTAVAAWNGLVGAVRSGISAVMGLVRGLPGQIMGALAGIGNWLIGSGRALIEGLWRGIQGAIGWVKGLISGALASIRNLFPFSPAKEGPFSGRGYTIHSGKALMTDFGRGIDAAPDLRPVVSGALRGAQSGLSGAVPGGSGGRGGGAPLQLVVAPGSDGAVAAMFMQLVRTNKIQLKAV